MRGNRVTRVGISCAVLLWAMAVSVQTSSHSEAKRQPLAGYTAILVEPFTVEKNEFTT